MRLVKVELPAAEAERLKVFLAETLRTVAR
jgi:hypothetical protein